MQRPCSATRTTLVGSMMPAATMSTYSSVWALKPKLPVFFQQLADNDGAFDASVFNDLADRGFERLGGRC